MTSTLKIDTIEPEGATTTLTVGESGQNTVIAGAGIKANVAKDAGGNAIFTSNGSGTISGLNSGFGSALTLISTQAVTNQASISFTSGIDSTYKEYIFYCIDINPATSSTELQFQVNAVGETGYNENFTASFFGADHTENNTSAGLSFDTGRSLYDSTAFQAITGGQSNDADAVGAGELHLYNPASTTYVKNFWATFNSYNAAPETRNTFVAGYFNITAAIDDIQFKMSSGNFDGTIKMYGVK